jgi:hypothetical protein
LLKPTRPKKATKKHLTARPPTQALARRPPEWPNPRVFSFVMAAPLHFPPRAELSPVPSNHPTPEARLRPAVVNRTSRRGPPCDVSDLDRGLALAASLSGCQGRRWRRRRPRGAISPSFFRFQRPIRLAASQPKVVAVAAASPGCPPCREDPNRVGTCARRGRAPLITGPSCRQNLGNAGDLYMVALRGGVLTISANPTNRRPGYLARPHAIAAATHPGAPDATLRTRSVRLPRIHPPQTPIPLRRSAQTTKRAASAGAGSLEPD